MSLKSGVLRGPDDYRGSSAQSAAQIAGSRQCADDVQVPVGIPLVGVLRPALLRRRPRFQRSRSSPCLFEALPTPEKYLTRVPRARSTVRMSRSTDSVLVEHSPSNTKSEAKLIRWKSLEVFSALVAVHASCGESS